MRILKSLILLLATVGLSSEMVHAQCTNPFGNYHADIDGDGYGSVQAGLESEGNSSIQFTSTGVIMQSSNQGNFANLVAVAYFTANATQSFTFDWSYTTNDEGPDLDRAYYLLGDVYIPISDDFGPQQQVGSITVNVNAGDEFGFAIDTWDNQGGAATLTISNFSGQVNFGIYNGCNPPASFVNNDDDCNDTNGQIHPGAIELCNNIDDDCNGIIEMNQNYYADGDGDGYGSALVTQITESNSAIVLTPTGSILYGPNGYSGGYDVTCKLLYTSTSNQTVTFNWSYISEESSTWDKAYYYINDQVFQISPNNLPPGVQTGGALSFSVSNGDVFGFGVISEDDTYGGATLTLTNFVANVAGQVYSCSAPAGYVSSNTDCDGSVAFIFPGAVELCNGLDDDCDGAFDEEVESTFYADVDGDGFGLTNAVVDVQGNSSIDFGSNGFTLHGSAGNDVPQTISISFPVLADQIYSFQWDYKSTDSDSYYDIAYYTINGELFQITESTGGALQQFDNWQVEVSEGSTFGFVLASDDNIGASSTFEVSFFSGMGELGIIKACTAPIGFGLGNNDCQPTIATMNPGASEVCNQIDDNCNGQIDEGLTAQAIPVVSCGPYTWTETGGTYNSSGTYYSHATSYNSLASFTSAANAGGYSISGAETFDAFSGLTSGANGNFGTGFPTWSASASGGFYSGNVNGNPTLRANQGYTPVTVYFSSPVTGVGGNFFAAATYFNVLNRTVEITLSDGSFVSLNINSSDAFTGFITNGALIESISIFSPFFPAENAYASIDNLVVLTGVPNLQSCSTPILALTVNTPETYYADADGDGFGNSGAAASACSLPDGYVYNNVDCNDSEDMVYPSATEVCNNVDDNCDGQVDENLLSQPQVVTACGSYTWAETGATYNASGTYYPHASAYSTLSSFTTTASARGYQISDTEDFSGYFDLMTSASGDLGVGFPTWTATQSSGQYPGIFATVVNGSEVLSGNAFASPVTIEFSSGVIGVGGNFFVASVLHNVLVNTVNISLSDGTTHSVVVNSSSAFTGFISNGALIESITINTPLIPVANPYVIIDNLVVLTGTPALSCDLEVLSLTINTPMNYYADADGDGFGDAGVTTSACISPIGYVDNSLDCDDAVSAAYPGAPELCNDFDENCDGLIDNIVLIYPDLDGDGFGAGASIYSCTEEDGYSLLNTDCNDNSSIVNPSAIEICNEIDDNCNGQTDEGVANLYYLDGDEDGYGNSATIAANTLINEDFFASNGFTPDIYNTGWQQQNLSNPVGGWGWAQGFAANYSGHSGASNSYIRAIYASASDVGTISNWVFTPEVNLVNGAVFKFWTKCRNPATPDRLQLRLSDNGNSVNVGNNEFSVGDFTALLIDINPNLQTWVYPGEWTEYTYVVSGIDTPTTGRFAFRYFIENGGPLADNANEVGIDEVSYIIPASFIQTCGNAPAGYVSNNTDCDDGINSVNPIAIEVCNTVDDNCNGQVDEGVLNTYYADADADGFGSQTTIQACTLPSGFVTNDSDCNDASASINPNTLWYLDEDGDGYYMNTLASCSSPGLNYSMTGLLSGDCNDSDVMINPNASEICNVLDDNCNGVVDDGVGTVFYLDGDEDGYGNSATVAANTLINEDFFASNGFTPDIYNTGWQQQNLSNPVGGWGWAQGFAANYSGHSGASNSYIRAIYASASDVGTISNWVFTPEVNLVNGAVFKFWTKCRNPATPDRLQLRLSDNGNSLNVGNNEFSVGDFTALLIDINPNLQTWVYPGDWTEYTYVVSGVDTPTTGRFAFRYFVENGGPLADNANEVGIDEVSYIIPASSIQTCGNAPAGYVSNNTDCDDSNTAVNIGSVEVCNSADDDCDTQIDEGLTFTNYYADLDGDAYGAGAATNACTQPTGFVATNTDCNDSNAAVNSAATEICNSIDDDCDTQIDEGVQNNYYADIDGDGFGAGAVITACSAPSGYVSTDTDCNDNSSSVNPSASETCNNIDDDCDTQIDEGVQNNYYADIDGDGFGAGAVITACSAPSGYVSTNTDCNDSNAAVNSAAIEICNSIDDDCDTQVDEGLSASIEEVVSCGPYTWVASGNTYSTSGTYYANTASAMVYNTLFDFTNALSANGYELSETEDFSGYSGLMASATGDLGVGFPTWTATQTQGQYPAIYAGTINGNQSISGNQFAEAVTIQFSSGVTGVGGNFFVSDVSGNVLQHTVNISLSDGTSASLTIGSAETFTGFVTNSGLIESITINTPPNFYNPYVRIDNLVVSTGVPEVTCGSNVLNLIVDVPHDYYADTDQDGYGAGPATNVCAQPSGYVTSSNDCDDNNASINLTATEICGNSIDENCDGVDAPCNIPGCINPTACNFNPQANLSDGSCTFPTVWYSDDDGDGYGDSNNSFLDCGVPAWAVSNDLDCNDGNDAVNIDAVEVCNSMDDDCDNDIDEGLLNTYYADLDGDGFGAGSATNASLLFAPGTSTVSVQGNQITIVGSNGDSDMTLFTLYSMTSTASQTVAFDWQYSTQDNSPEFDPAYYLVNGDPQDLSELTGPLIQSGQVQVTLVAGDILQFLVGTEDDALGAATLVISNLTGSFNTAISACSQPAGYVTMNTDCNDGSSAIYPSAAEVCGNNIDEDCTGADLVCPANTINPVNIVSIGNYGTGTQTSINVNLSTGSDNVESAGYGLDKWYQFTAQSNAVRVALTGNTLLGDDNDVALYDYTISAGSPLIPLKLENDVAPNALGIAGDGGNEILYYDQLVVGNIYWICIRNLNSIAGNVNMKIAYLGGSTMDIGPYTNYTNIYSNTCQNFKCKFKSGAFFYTFNLWNGNSNVGQPYWMYSTAPSATASASTVVQLGKLVGANLSSSAVQYTVVVDAHYALQDAFGNVEQVVGQGTQPGVFGLNVESDLNLRTTDRCPIYKSAVNGSVATNRSVCGASKYQWEFTLNAPNSGLPVLLYGALGGSRLITLSSIPGIANAQQYDVRISALHLDQITHSSFGTSACMRTYGFAGVPTVEDGGVIAERSENGVTTSIYPNPNNGQSVNFAVSGMEGEMNLRIADATGRMVYANRYIVEGSLNTTIDFGQTLAGGVYMVEMIQNGEMKTMRMVVSK